MNSKAIKRQLFAAIAMVLVSAIALSSSTYAWFASNNKVTATGMSVAAQTEGSLLVIDNDATDFGKTTQTTVDMSLTGTNLFPTHLTTADKEKFEVTGTSTWTHSFSKDYTKAITNPTDENALKLTVGDTQKTVYGSTEQNVVKQDVTQYYDADGKQYFLAGTMYIGLNSQNSTAKCGAITLESSTITSSSQLNGSVRVALVPLGTFDASADSGKGKYTAYGADDIKLAGIVAPGNEYVTTRGTNATADTTAAYAAGTIAITSGNMEAGDYVKLAVYIYFDGRDDDCTSEHFDTTEVAVTLNFAAADASST